MITSKSKRSSEGHVSLREKTYGIYRKNKQELQPGGKEDTEKHGEGKLLHLLEEAPGAPRLRGLPKLLNVIIPRFKGTCSP